MVVRLSLTVASTARIVAVCAIAIIAAAACGGPSAGKSKSTTRSKQSNQAVGPSHLGAVRAAARASGNLKPVEVDVKIVRVGDSVRLDVSGVGRHRPAKHAMEHPDNWVVHLLADKQMMPRTVNGSVKVERFEVGNPAHKLWDIEVGFSMAYAIPSDVKELTVRITAPDSPVYERTVAAKSIETKKTKLDKKREREARREREAKRAEEKRAKRKKARREKRKRERAKRKKAEREKAKAAKD